MTARGEGARPLEDEDLREEIDLLVEVIVTASEYPKHLTSQQIDAALHLPLLPPGTVELPGAAWPRVGCDGRR